jgi:mono/diheme cytochrome c family protein
MRILLIASLLVGFASVPGWAADPKAGQAVYDKHCKTCHGPNGAAPPNVAKFQGGRILDLRSAHVKSTSDADLAKIVTKGSGKMRGDTSISGGDMENLIAFVHSL